MGQLSVSLEAADTVIDGAVRRGVGMAGLQKLPDHVQHARDLLRSLRMHRGRADVHARHVLFALFDVALGDLGGIHALLGRSLDDLVVHIREVRDEVHLVTLILKIAANRVEEDHGPRVSDMDEVVYGGSADIHSDLSRLDRDKLFLVSGQCIENFHNVSFPLLVSAAGSSSGADCSEELL